MGLQAAAVGDVGNEDEVVHAVADVEGHDPGERAVGGDRSGRSRPGHGEAEERGQEEDEPPGRRVAPAEGARRRPSVAPRATARALQAPGMARTTGGSAAEPARAPGKGGVEPAQAREASRGPPRRLRRPGPSRENPPSPPPGHEDEVERVARGERARREQEPHQGHRPGPVPGPLQAVELGHGREPVEQELEVQARGAFGSRSPPRPARPAPRRSSARSGDPGCRAARTRRPRSRAAGDSGW